MVYNQYSSYAYTGNVEGVKNRISSNSADTNNSEDTLFPIAYDLFVNKENASNAGFGVSEQHSTADLAGSKVYLDHRLFVDTTGGYAGITSSNGTIDQSSINLTEGSVSFSSVPTDTTYALSYSARSDKVFDSHINALQNAVMRLQQKFGLQAAIGGIGTGLSTLELVTNYTPPNQGALDGIKNNILPNIVTLGHLEGDLKIGSTNNSLLSSHGGVGVVVTLGNHDASGPVDAIQIDGELFKVSNKLGARPVDIQLGASTGDVLGVSGLANFRSQVTIGLPGAGAGAYQGFVPNLLTGFYNEAMLRVNGGIYFGAGMSGNGNVTFVTTTGGRVDIVGDLEATDLHVENTSQFDGQAVFLDFVDARSPGYFTTNKDIELRTKTNGEPALIDGLDPSYGQVATESAAEVFGAVTTHLRSDFGTLESTPYVSGAKRHPVHDFFMYPMLGGWGFTGVVQFAKASDHSSKNVLICDSYMLSIDTVAAREYGSYSQGLFNPGDTFLEIENGSSERVTYPIYYHDKVFEDGQTHAGVTGFNLYLATDDDVLVSPTVNGQNYRIFQPSNIPARHLSTDFSTDTSPTVTFGNDGNGYYGQGAANRSSFVTQAAYPGPSVGPDVFPIYKQLSPGSVVTENLLTALQRSVDHEKIIATTNYTTVGAQKGIAYIYATSANNKGTEHTNVLLKASPSPWGLAHSQVFGSNVTSINPGQWALVGEVVAQTSIAQAGTAWSLIETVSYRPNAFYDSCWVPLVTYRGANQAVGHDTIPDNIGRCLPFHGTTDVGSADFDDGEGDHNFYVEHNIGPVHNLSELSVRVFVARYNTDYTRESENVWDSRFRQTAAGSANLWTPFNAPYQGHEFTNSPGGSVGEGALKEITGSCQIRYFDSRFCRISVVATADADITAGSLPGYIRVIVKRTR
jgi:hypothetical protein